MSFLGNTKKSGPLDRKNSAKLPKLTIQQKIDNNEVFQRMNRKVTFTKNQRHLGKTMQYVQAFESSSNGSVFRIDPMNLYFTNFQANKIYQSQLKLVNGSKHLQRIKITPLQKKEFVVSNVKYPIEDSGDIAPGMQVSIFVRFKPTNLHDIQDQLIIIVGDGVVKIPIKAQRQKCQGQWPKQVNCGHCWVGDQQSKQIIVANNGGQAIYRLQGANGKEQKTVGVFKIWPTELKIQKKNKNPIHVLFSPKTQGLFQQKIIFSSNQGQQQKIIIRLKGGAYSAQITLDQINNQKVAVKKYHNFLYLNNCQPGKQSSSSFKIHNHAVVPVDYLWHFQSEPNFSISQQKGKISPSQIMNFNVKYKPTNRNPKSILAFMYLYNLPKESIQNNTNTKMINGVLMIQCLKLQVKVTSKDSDVDISPLHKKMSEKLYKGKAKRTSFTIQNNSKVQRKFWISKIKEDQFCHSNCEIEGQKIIKSGQSEQIWFSFMISQLGLDSKKAYFLVNFDNLPAKLISIEGIVQYPTLQLYTTDIEYQLMRTNSIYRKQFRLSNPGENDVQFRFDNPHRFYQLDFYDFYQFQSEKFYKDKLKITCQEDQCDKWTVISAHQEKILCFQYSTKDPQDFDINILLLIKDGNTYNIRVTGDIQQPLAKVSQNYVPLKELFQGNVYNSNKLLPKQLSIDNPGNIKISYQIIPASCQQLLINISVLKGVIQPKSKKRIDLILQPLKTGPFSPVFQVNFYDDNPLHSQNFLQLDQIIQIVPQQRKKLFKIEQLKLEGNIRGVQTSYFIKDQSRAKKIVQKLPLDEGHGSVKMSTYSHSHKSASGTASRSHYMQSFKIIYPPLEELNFYNCEINKVQQLEIIIQNNSELTTQFDVFAENFRSIQKAASQTKSFAKGMMNSEQMAFTSNMGKTYLENRALNQAQKIYLSNNKGISIMCEPSSGVLYKRRSQNIIVTMFNDTSGRFKDNLVISIKDHETKKFPINMQIKGTPVSLSRNQIGINFNKQIPLLNAGTFLVNSGKSTRNIKIVNNGPKQVQLKWVMYPYGSSNSQQNLFNISFVNSEPGTNKIVDTIWQAIKPKPLQKSPFSITPSQKLLKGRQQVNFTLTVQQSSSKQNIQVLVIGQPMMIEDDKKQEGEKTSEVKDQKVNKVPMQQLAIIVEAQIVTPSLRMDQRHINQLNIFERYAVTGNEERTKARDYHREIKLKNHQRCNQSFSVYVQTINSKSQFFQLVSSSTDSPLSKLRPKTLGTLNSKSKTLSGQQVQRQFVLPFQSFVQLGIDLKGNPKNIDQWPLDEKVRKDGNLIINFVNGQKQIIPLVGWLYRPYLHIQMPNHNLHSIQNVLIEFGVVHVKNHKKKSIYLANPTKSAADWSISYVKYQQTKKIIFQKQLWTNLDYEDETITDEKKCFRLSHDSGHLLAESIPIHYIPGTLALYNADDNYAQTHKPFKLDFVFKPQNNVLYKSKFILKVEHGPSYQIIVRGKGTFEQQAQIK